MYKNIDEAIEEFRECYRQNMADLDITFAEENEQIVDWLCELKALKEKSVAKKVTEFVEFEEDSFYSLTFMCPNCKSSVFGQPYKPKHCKHCGCGLDWE